MKQLLIASTIALALLLAGCANRKVGTFVNYNAICRADSNGSASCHSGKWNFDITSDKKTCTIDGYYQSFGSTYTQKEGALDLYIIEGLMVAEHRRLNIMPGRPVNGEIRIHRDFRCPAEPADGYIFEISYMYKD